MAILLLQFLIENIEIIFIFIFLSDVRYALVLYYKEQTENCSSCMKDGSLLFLWFTANQLVDKLIS